MTIRHVRTKVRRRVELAANSSDQLNLWILNCLAQDGMCEQLVTSCEATGVLQSVGIWINEQLGERRQVVKAEQAVRARLATLLVADRSRPVFQNVEMLGDLLQVDATSREILAMSVMCDDRHSLDMCMTQLGRLADGNVTQYFQLLADVIGHPVDAVRAALGPDSVLRRAGLLTFSLSRMKYQENPLECSQLARTLLDIEHSDAQALVGGLVEPAAAAELTLADYAHLAVDVADLRAYLCRALVAKRRGVNVLLYGLPGTGKTQLARALAHDLGVTLYQVRVAGDGGLALPRHERFSSFQLCQSLLQNRADVLVLFDEVEDAFPSALLQAFGEEPSKEKGWVNRLLEDNPVPAFWLTNKVDEIDLAFLRRFDIILEVPVPPRNVRRQMLAKEVQGLAVSERWLDRCAADPDITPADIARVARVAREISPSDPEATLTRLLDRHLSVRRGPKAPAYRLGPIDYDLTYVNADIDVRVLAESLRKRPNSNVCLYGPPGTGKTALVHWLAETLGKPLLNKRASDLLGMYVGQTEARIAAMFQEATREQAVLLLDEADSFLRDRRGASQVWEVTQVNQLLMQMEAFDGIFICSTNLIDQLDEAAFRRFAFKIEFSPLTTEQCLRLLVDTLGQLGSPGAGELDVAAAALNGATVGDFAAVARKFATLEERPGLDALVQALKQELRHRQPSRKPAGFLA